MPYIKIDNNKIFYNDTGKGDPLVLLHNGFYSSKTWDGIRNSLSRHFRVIDYDRFGYGKSAKCETLTGDIIEKGVFELELLLQELEIKEFSVLGHCLGGAIGLVYAEKHPQQVKKIVSEAVGVYGDIKTYYKSECTFRPFDLLDYKIQEILTEMHGKDYVKKFWKICSEYKESYIMSDTYDIRHILNKIKCPVFIIQGDRDFYFEIDRAIEMYKKIPKSQLCIMPNTHHDVHIERKKEFVNYVIDFFKQA
jgi:pimeloyl-ACP methyl ester carboxylesterase